MAKTDSTPTMSRVTHVLGFFIGICGALAILGVFFKITGGSLFGIGYEVFMKAGFMGEAGAFLIMGALELISAFLVKGDDDSRADDENEAVSVSNEPAAAQLRQMMDEKASEQLDELMTALGEEVKAFGREMRSMREEMRNVRSAAETMKTEMEAAGGGQLTEETEKLAGNVQRLSWQLGEAGNDMEQVQAVVQNLRAALGKTQAGELEHDAERLGTGMKQLSDEVHEMSGEMEPARSAVQAMRAELERVTDGNLADNAEALGSEMRGAGESVEAARKDLDRMAARFRKFNDPGSDPSSSAHSNGQAEHKHEQRSRKQ